MAVSIRRGHRSGSGIRTPRYFMMIMTLVFLSIVLFLSNYYWSSSGHQIKQTVQQFYEYEQAGNYGSAWEFFHSSMKDKFSKEQYIQQRANVYMQQLGANTFQFKIGKVRKIGVWSMAEMSPAISEVYEIRVTQSFLSVFGKLSINQQVFAAKENDEWKLIWDYHE